MTVDPNTLKINPGDILGWPSLRIQYPTDPAKIGMDPFFDPSNSRVKA